MEAPNNTHTTAAPTSQTETLGQEAGASEQRIILSRCDVQESQDSLEVDETTIKLTIEQDAQKLLITTENALSIVIEGNAETVQAAEQKTKELLIDAKEHDSIKVVGASHIVLSVEEGAKQLFIEAETHESFRVVLHDTQTFGNFWLKCMNDWVFNFASGLAYSLLMAMFPIVIALVAVVGFVSGRLSSNAQSELITNLNTLFPSIRPGQSVLNLPLVITLLRQNAGFLSILAIVLAIFSGSRLFVALEDYFDIIYHTPARSFWRQNVMAIGMLLIFIVLIPIMLFASSIGLGGFLGGLLASWLLFLTIFMVVPNQHISLRNSWLGALVAAFALQVYVAIFPFYVEHFMGSYNGATGFAVILLLFFYYFAVILLLGAEVNAFYAEGIRGTPTNIAGLVHQATLVSDQQELAALAQQKSQQRSAL